MANYTFVAPRTLEPTVAIIKCTTPDYTGNYTSVIKAIREAISNWLAFHQEGRNAWKESCRDFNWGDLTHYCQLMSLSHHLRAKGIFQFTVEVSAGTSNLDLTFDDVFHPSTN